MVFRAGQNSQRCTSVYTCVGHVFDRWPDTLNSRYNHAFVDLIGWAVYSAIAASYTWVTEIVGLHGSLPQSIQSIAMFTSLRYAS
jgi:hypothetical protein